MSKTIHPGNVKSSWFAMRSKYDTEIRTIEMFLERSEGVFLFEGVCIPDMHQNKPRYFLKRRTFQLVHLQLYN